MNYQLRVSLCKISLVLLFSVLQIGVGTAQNSFSIDSLYREANYLHNNGNPQQAIFLYSEVINKHKDHYLAINNRSLCYAILGRYDSAIIGYDYLIEIKPERGIAYLNKGIALKATGKYAEAMWYYQKAEILYGTRLDILYSCMGSLMSKWHLDYDSALFYHNLSITENPNYYNAYVTRASTYRKKGNYAKAIKDLEVASRIKPDNHDVKIGYGLLYSDMKYYYKSNEMFSEAIKLTPNSFEGHYNRGWNNIVLKQFNEAFEDFDMAVNIYPSRSNAYVNRGLSRYYLKQYEEAIEDYKAAINLSAQVDIIYNNMGNAYFAWGQTAEACKCWQSAINNGYKFKEEWREQFGIEDPVLLIEDHCD